MTGNGEGESGHVPVNAWNNETQKTYDDMIVELGREAGVVESPTPRGDSYYFGYADEPKKAAVHPLIFERLVAEGRIDAGGVPTSTRRRHSR